jgi:archaellum component FlaC
MDELRYRISKLEADIERQKAEIETLREHLLEVQRQFVQHVEDEIDQTERVHESFLGVYEDVGELTDYLMPLVHKSFPGSHKPFEDFMKKWQDRRSRDTKS